MSKLRESKCRSETALQFGLRVTGKEEEEEERRREKEWGFASLNTLSLLLTLTLTQASTALITRQKHNQLMLHGLLGYSVLQQRIKHRAVSHNLEVSGIQRIAKSFSEDIY